MYKARMKKWGLRKNLAASEIETLQPHAPSPGKQWDGIFTIRGRQVECERVRLYIRRKSAAVIRAASEPGQSSSSIASLRGRSKMKPEKPADILQAPSSLMLPLGPTGCFSPESVRRLEVPCHFARVHVWSSVDSGIWGGADKTKSWPSCKRSQKWITALWDANKSIGSGEYTLAFQRLDACFDQFQYFIRQPDPRLLFYSLMAVHMLPPPINQYLLEYAIRMAEIKASTQHPLRLFWSSMRQNGFEYTLHHLRFVLDVYLQSLTKVFGDCNLAILTLQEEVYMILENFGLVPRDTVLTYLAAINERQISVKATVAVQRTKLCICFLLYKDRKLLQAEIVRRDVLHSIDAEAQPDLGLRYVCLEIGFLLGGLSGDPESLRLAEEQLAGFCKEHWGERSEKTLGTLELIAKYKQAWQEGADLGSLDRGLDCLWVWTCEQME
jgi:hypothetical protein